MIKIRFFLAEGGTSFDLLHPFDQRSAIQSASQVSPPSTEKKQQQQQKKQQQRATREALGAVDPSGFRAFVRSGSLLI